MIKSLLPTLTFKTSRILEEFQSPELDWRLRGIVYSIAAYVLLKFGLVVELTDIYRTRQEQKDIYDNEEAQFSPHEFWRAVDIVIRGLSNEKYQRLAEWINENFPYQKAGYATCKYHSQIGWHLHIQVAAIGDMKRFFERG